MKNKTLQGRGCSVETSLKKCGFAWSESAEEFVFFCGVGPNQDDEFDMFERGTLSVNTNLQTTFTWVDWEACRFTELTPEEFFDQPLPLQVEELVNYYGFENIFRSYYFAVSYEELIDQTE